MSVDLTCQCTVAPTASLSRKLEQMRSATASVTSRVTALETTVASLSVVEHGRVVTTEAELLACRAIGMPAFVSGEIDLLGSVVDGRPVGVNATMEDWKVTGLSNGVTKGRLRFLHVAGAPRTVIKISAKNVMLREMELTTDHPLTTTVAPPAGGAGPDSDYGIELSEASDKDLSGLVIEGCEIHDVYTPIRRTDSLLAMASDGTRIVNNNLHSFCYGGIDMRSNVRRAQIERNRIFGRDTPGSTHQVLFNGIWLGNNADYAQIHKNDIAYCGRHGIEYWNSQTAAETVGGNQSGKITKNNIHDLLNHAGIGSFGITAFGAGGIHILGNSIQRATLGIEIYNDPINTAKILCSKNVIDEITAAGTPLAMSIDGVTNALVEGNILGRVISTGAAGTEAFGMQVINGGDNLTIRGNEFLDSGNKMLLLNGARLTITGITKAANGVVTVVENLTGTTRPWINGRPIFLRNIVGMTELEGTYATITVTGLHTFTLGVDTSAFVAVGTGGVAENAWRRITIENNKFDFSEILNGAAESRAMWMYDVQNVVAKNNTAWVKTGLIAGSMRVQRGNVNIGHSAEAPLPWSASDVDLGGSNLVLNY